MNYNKKVHTSNIFKHRSYIFIVVDNIGEGLLLIPFISSRSVLPMRIQKHIRYTLFCCQKHHIKINFMPHT